MARRRFDLKAERTSVREHFKANRSAANPPREPFRRDGRAGHKMAF